MKGTSLMEIGTAEENWFTHRVRYLRENGKTALSKAGILLIQGHNAVLKWGQIRRCLVKRIKIRHWEVCICFI